MKTRTKDILALISLASITTVVVCNEVAINVPSDLKAKYFVMEKTTSGNTVTITTKRVGPNGTSYSRRLYNCANATFKYLGDGDTYADMEKSKPDSKMSPLTGGSVSAFIGLEACKK